MRAAQRTFEGAYTRTALSQFSFALVVLKIFTHEFYPIGALFAVFGFCILLAAALRRRGGNKQFFQDGEGRRFRTSGNVSIGRQKVLAEHLADNWGSHKTGRYAGNMHQRCSIFLIVVLGYEA
jgi:hypothetical protein